MATASPTFSRSTDAFGFSPPLLTEQVPAIDGQRTAAQTSTTSVGASVVAPRISSQPPKPSGRSGHSEWTSPPHTAPRSMRRKITPPPLRRGDSYRPFEHQEPFVHHGSHSRSSVGHCENEVGNRVRSAAPGCHRSAVYHYSQNDSDNQKMSAPTEAMPEYDEDAAHPTLSSSSKQPSGRNKEDTRGQVKVTPAMISRGRQPPSASNHSSGFDARYAGIVFAEKRKNLADKILNSLRSVPVRDDTEHGEGGGTNHSRTGVSDREDRLEQMAAEYEVLESNGGPGSASSGGNCMLSTASSPRQVNVSSVPTVDLSTSPNHLHTLCHGYTGPDAGRIDTIEEGHLNMPARGRSMLTALREMIGPQTAARISNEDTASTSSTATSRSKAVCKACGVPGSQVTPLVPCSRCRKGYHDRCGNPKPQNSAKLDDFVCGRCLRKRSREVVGRSDLESRSTDRSFPVDANTPGRSVPTSNLHTPTISQVPASNLIPEGNDGKNVLISEEAMQGSLYKHITCPHWKHERCIFLEAHCLFAHKDTGQDAPRGDAPAKAFTCPGWKKNEQCLKSPSECALSHKDTGLYLGPDNKPSRKHITCYYWNLNNQCNKSEEDCPFAHKTTGILAWQPWNAPMTQSRTDLLRCYPCPRWEATGNCRRLHSGCPYMHSRPGKSCLDIENTLDARAGRDTQLKVQGTRSIPPTPIPELSAVPTWARNARTRPVSFLNSVIPGGTNKRMTESRSTADGVNAAKPASVQSDPRSADFSVGNKETSPQEASDRPTSKSVTLTDPASKPNKHMAKRHAITFDPRKRRAQAPEAKPDSTLLGNNSTEAVSNRDKRGTAHTPFTSGGQIAQSGRPSSLDAGQIDLGKIRAHCGDDSVLFNSFLSICKDFGDQAVDPRETMQKAANIFNDRPLLMQDLDVFLPLRYRIECGAREATDLNGSRELDGSILHFPVHNITSLKSFATDTSTITAGRKLCEGCHKPIFGNAPRCVRCSVSIGKRQNQDQVSDEAMTGVSVLLPVAQASSEPPSALDCPEGDSHTHDDHRPTSPSYLQRYLMPNTLKRTVSEDMLFVPRKKTKAVPLSINAAREVLRRSSAGHDAGSTSEAYSEGYHSRWRRSLEYLMRSEVLEQTRVGEESTAVCTNTMASVPLEGSIDRSHRPREALLGSDSGRLGETSLPLPSMDSETDLDGVGTQLPGTLHLAEARSSGAGPTKAPIYNERRTRLTHSTTHGTELVHEHLCQESLGTTEIQEATTNELVPNNVCVSEPAREPSPTADQPYIISVDSNLKNTSSDGSQRQCGCLDPLNSDTFLPAREHRCHRGVSAAACSDMVHTANHDQQAGFTSSHDITSRTRPDVLVRSSSGTWVSARPLRIADNDKGDPRDNVAPSPPRSPCRATVFRQSSITMSDIEDGDDVPLNKLRDLDRVREINSADITLLFTGTRKKRVLSSTTQPSSIGGADSTLSEGQESSTATEVDHPIWANKAKQKAVAQLKAQGVLFESDSDSDSDDSRDSVAQPLRQPTNPLRALRQLNILSDVESYSTTQVSLSSGRHDRPSRKQLVGNLLKYQCREQRRKFGNPHQEVNRRLEEVEVKASVQRETRLDTPDPFAVGRLERTMVTMSVEEFLGVPEEPVIAFGKNKDELVFIEAKKVRGGRTMRSTRSRRVKDDEKFPFVYK